MERNAWEEKRLFTKCYSPAVFVVYATSFNVKIPRLRSLADLTRASRFLGGLTARVTPVPIPNTEVKPRRADDTALETTRERRSPPGLKYRGRSVFAGRPFCFGSGRMLVGYCHYGLRSQGRPPTSLRATRVRTASLPISREDGDTLCPERI